MKYFIGKGYPIITNDKSYDMSKYYADWIDSMAEYCLSYPKKKFIDYINEANSEVAEKNPDIIVKLAPNNEWMIYETLEGFGGFTSQRNDIKSHLDFLSKNNPEDKVGFSGLYTIIESPKWSHTRLILFDFQIISAVFYWGWWLVQLIGNELMKYSVSKSGCLYKELIDDYIFQLVHYNITDDEGNIDRVVYYIKDGKMFDVNNKRGVNIVGIIEEDFSDMDF